MEPRRHHQHRPWAVCSGAALPFSRAQLDPEQRVGRFQLFEPPACQHQGDTDAHRCPNPASGNKPHAKTKPGMHIEESHTLPPIVLDNVFPALGASACDTKCVPKKSSERTANRGSSAKAATCLAPARKNC